MQDLEDQNNADLKQDQGVIWALGALILTFDRVKRRGKKVNLDIGAVLFGYANKISKHFVI